MLTDIDLIERLILFTGELTILAAIIIIVFGLFLVTLTFYAMRTGKILFPGLLVAGLVLLEGLIKALFKLFGLEEQELIVIFIKIHNTVNSKAFATIPVEERAVFVPQCLRSAKCPAHLTPEGLKCINCGLCKIGYEHQVLEKLGYKFFIVPGSSFIKRIIKQYRPKALIGIGCLIEVKDGIEMADKFGIIAMGIVNLKDGCVETDVNWQEVLETAMLGVSPEISKVGLKGD